MADEAPDLNAEHRAIGQHFKRFPDRKEVWHNAERRWYPLAEFETHVRIYDDRVRGWFLEAARQLPHDGFVVLMIVAAYFEGNEQYRQGETSEKKSRSFFGEAFDRIFPALASSGAAKTFYEEARCGLFHDGMTRGSIRISNHFASPIEANDGKLFLNPNKLLDVVIGDHALYVRDLLDPANDDLRTKFKKIWESRWSQTY